MKTVSQMFTAISLGMSLRSTAAIVQERSFTSFSIVIQHSPGLFSSPKVRTATSPSTIVTSTMESPTGISTASMSSLKLSLPPSPLCATCAAHFAGLAIAPTSSPTCPDSVYHSVSSAEAVLPWSSDPIILQSSR